MQEYAQTIDQAQQASHVFFAAPLLPPLQLLLQPQGQLLGWTQTLLLYQSEQPPYYFSPQRAGRECLKGMRVFAEISIDQHFFGPAFELEQQFGVGSMLKRRRSNTFSVVISIQYNSFTAFLYWLRCISCFTARIYLQVVRGQVSQVVGMGCQLSYSFTKRSYSGIMAGRFTIIICWASLAYCFTTTMSYILTGCQATGAASGLIFFGLPRPRLGAAGTPCPFSSYFTAYLLTPLNLSLFFFLPRFLGSLCTSKQLTSSPFSLSWRCTISRASFNRWLRLAWGAKSGKKSQNLRSLSGLRRELSNDQKNTVLRIVTEEEDVVGRMISLNHLADLNKWMVTQAGHQGQPWILPHTTQSYSYCCLVSEYELDYSTLLLASIKYYIQLGLADSHLMDGGRIHKSFDLHDCGGCDG